MSPATAAAGPLRQQTRRPPTLVWLDLVKAVAIAWIFLNHWSERLFGGPLIANPYSGWPPLAARVAQLRPLADYGPWNPLLNLLRYVGWAGDQGVQLFLIASGFGLTWGLLQKWGDRRLDLRTFYAARATRIYPLWWVCHFVFAAGVVVTARAPRLDDPAFYLSLAGIRATSATFYYFAPAWWYIGLLLQLYVVYPLLWEGLRRRGPLWLLVIGCAIAFAVRAAGLWYCSSCLDAWSRGAIFITRLPEFIFGMCIAAWLFSAPESTAWRMRSLMTQGLAVAGYVAGSLLSLTLLGMTVAPFVLGAAVFLILYRCVGSTRQPGGRIARPGVWVGRHSYSLFLCHQPVIAFLIPAGLAAADVPMMWVRSGIAIVVTVLLALGVEAIADTIMAGVRQGFVVMARRVVYVAAIVASAYLPMLGAEWAVRTLDPREVGGWGERPSLKPDPVFGWRLKPNQTTRLRWDGYDYTVHANALGFPGPEYSRQKPAGVYRVLVTGDAFTSAEGVDTDQAWPRLLERDLALAAHRHVEVLNFAITGYGPNQYAAVLAQFVPRYRPDLVLIGFFVNDFEDALITNKQFQADIGFDRPPPDSWRYWVSLAHLRSFLKRRLAAPVYELVTRRPAPHGYFYGQFGQLERDRPRLYGAGRAAAKQRLAEIAATAQAAGARLLLAVIPAPVQVCRPSELRYYPRNVDLHDGTRFDLDLPQRMTREIAGELGIAALDLRAPLRAATPCPYQPNNLHWTAAGHQVVAAYLSRYLMASGYLGQSPSDRGDT